MSKQHIPMDGTPNFRDLGGYEARDGRRVRYGKLFRSGVLSQLSDADLSTFTRLRISTICDFRRPEETERDPTRLSASKPARIVHLPIDPGSRGSFFEQISETSELTEAERSFDMAGFMVDINRAFALDHQQPFNAMLDELMALPDDEALLFHCAAGKDRTGYAAALILMCLDVPREAIEQDYMATGDFFDPDLEMSRLIKKYAEFGFEKVDSALVRPLLEVRAEYIREAFAAIDGAWPSTDDFLRETYGMTAERRAQLKQQLLE